MQCTGSYRTVGDLNDCFKHCTADAKCKAFVTTQEIPTIEKLVNWNRQQSCALLLATMGLGQIPITISKYEWRHFRWILRKGPWSNMWTRQLLLDMKWMLHSINARSIEQYQRFFLRRQQFRTRNYTTSVGCEGIFFDSAELVSFMAQIAEIPYVNSKVIVHWTETR